MDIGGVSAPVILAMVDLNFVRTAPWEAMFCIICPMLVILSKISYTVPSLQSFCIFLQQLHFGCGLLQIYQFYIRSLLRTL
jgi:hypothetical protein